MEAASATNNFYFSCCVEWCLSTNKSHQLFNFPSNIDEASMWLKICDRIDLLPLLQVSDYMPDNFLLCDEHFSDSQFTVRSDNKRSLIDHAMPMKYGDGAEGALEVENQITDRNESSNNGKTCSSTDINHASSWTTRRRRCSSNRGLKCESFGSSSVNAASNSKKQSNIRTAVRDRSDWASGGCGDGIYTWDGSITSSRPCLSLPLLHSSALTKTFCREHDINASCAQVGRQQLLDWESEEPAVRRRRCKRWKRFRDKSRQKHREDDEVHIKKLLQYCQYPLHLTDVALLLAESECDAEVVGEGTRECAMEHCLPPVNTKLHKFPLAPQRCWAWVDNCGEERLAAQLLSLGTRGFHDGVRLCAQHFQDTCYCADKLVSDAVPTLFGGRSIKHPCQHQSTLLHHCSCEHSDCAEAVDAKNGFSKRKRKKKSNYRSCDPIKDNKSNLKINTNFHEPRRKAGDEAATKAAQDRASPLLPDTQREAYQEQAEALAAEVALLQSRLQRLALHKKRQKEQRHRYEATLAKAREPQPLHASCQQATAYFHARLPYATARFLQVQVGRSCCSRWNIRSMDIPIIANRCGMPVRELLGQLFVMPHRATISKYRTMVKKNPSFADEDSILRNDVNKKYHRRLNRRSPDKSKNISAIINKYMKRRNLEIEAPVEGNTRSRKLSYKHNKCNDPSFPKSGDIQ